MNVSFEQIINATWITVYISVLSFILGTLIAFFLGFTLYFTRKGGIYENRKLYVTLDIVINFIRSLPFVVLLLLLIPVTRLLVGSAIGPNAVIVSLTFFAAPYIARLVESSLLEIDHGILEVADSLGANTRELLTHFLLPEAASSLIFNLSIAFVSIIGATAVAGTIGGGGLGDLAISFGYNRYDYITLVTAVGIIVVLVQLAQFLGKYLSNKAKYL